MSLIYINERIKVLHIHPFRLSVITSFNELKTHDLSNFINRWDKRPFDACVKLLYIENVCIELTIKP